VEEITGVVQHYAWGDPTFIPELLGRQPDGQPWAELWLGTHPNGPSRLADGRPLDEVTGPLPYLLKVLAAAEPLSLQTHPSEEQARDGYQRGVFGDPYAKPELLCALTRFDALCGVRPVDETSALLGEIGLDRLGQAIAGHGVAATIAGLFAGDIPIAPIVDACEPAAATHREAELVTRLAARYPGDPSVAITLLLNRVTLEPGEAIRLGPGNLHAYLHGAGIELMGASDNVVRGGLTTKRVDVDLLLATLDDTPLFDPVLDAADHYELPGTTIALRRRVGPVEHTARGQELLVTSDGRCGSLTPGERWQVPDGITAYIATT